MANGSYRHVADSAPGFQVLGGQFGPSHAFVNAVDFGGSVTVHSTVVKHNDALHADLHGAVVIPSDVVKDTPQAVAEMNRRVAGILAVARSADFSMDELKAVISGDGDIH